MKNNKRMTYRDLLELCEKRNLDEKVTIFEDIGDPFFSGGRRLHKGLFYDEQKDIILTEQVEIE